MLVVQGSPTSTAVVSGRSGESVVLLSGELPCTHSARRIEIDGAMLTVQAE